MTEEELASATGVSAATIQRLVELGIVPGRGGDRPFEPTDIHRIRLAEAFERSGVDLDAIGRAVQADLLSFAFLDGMFAHPPAPVSTRTFREIEEDLGVPPETLTRLYAMWGLSRPAPDDLVRSDDEPTYVEWKALFPPDAMREQLLTQGARLFGEATSRIADWGMELYRTYVEQPLLAAGMSPQGVLDTASGFAGVSMPVMERQLIWLLRRKLEHDTFQLIIEYVEVALESAGIAAPTTSRPPAIAFVDLSGYTELTERIGDQPASDHAAALGTLLQDLAHAHGGRVVKLLGDGAMLYFPSPAEAVRCGIRIVREVERAGLPPARVGIAAGTLVFREGDYYGRVVNLASRVMGRAGPRQVLVTAEVVAATDSVRFEPLGPVLLKGIAAPVELALVVR